ncbi:hypothetical protein CHLRE_13g577000v5 [Chlamydomonas reinhardtii]|uniref:Uncharacterized protein n=1 Tax=Chlamydomonas reinhardtii TaxID=3055 RepID=A0A2K3D052_CHLRE|nr:uncharacterized protein CHLRE_13g577000v5 [Chlamydomonas reinhardtii]PNW73891.1 hypothetical protein CHLRE_13g577000v5 [Chlamydomonas reinhardtii]
MCACVCAWLHVQVSFPTLRLAILSASSGTLTPQGPNVNAPDPECPNRLDLGASRVLAKSFSVAFEISCTQASAAASSGEVLFKVTSASAGPSRWFQNSVSIPLATSGCDSTCLGSGGGAESKWLRYPSIAKPFFTKPAVTGTIPAAAVAVAASPFSPPTTPAVTGTIPAAAVAVAASSFSPPTIPAVTGTIPAAAAAFAASSFSPPTIPAVTGTISPPPYPPSPSYGYGDYGYGHGYGGCGYGGYGYGHRHGGYGYGHRYGDCGYGHGYGGYGYGHGYGGYGYGHGYGGYGYGHGYGGYGYGHGYGDYGYGHGYGGYGSYGQYSHGYYGGYGPGHGY